MKTLSYLVCLLSVLIIFSGCGSPESKFVGKWVGKTGSIEFFKNKTGLINPPARRLDLPANVHFIWRVEGSDTVTMIFDLPGGRTSFGKLVRKNTLEVEDDEFVKQ